SVQGLPPPGARPAERPERPCAHARALLPERLRQRPDRRVEPEPAEDRSRLRRGLPPPVGRGVVPEPQLGEFRDGRDLDHRPQWPAVALAPRGYLLRGREEADVGPGRVRVVTP